MQYKPLQMHVSDQSSKLSKCRSFPGLPGVAAGQAAGISGMASSLPGRRDDGFWEDLLEKKVHHHFGG